MSPLIFAVANLLTSGTQGVDLATNFPATGPLGQDGGSIGAFAQGDGSIRGWGKYHPVRVRFGFALLEDVENLHAAFNGL